MTTFVLMIAVIMAAKRIKSDTNNIAQAIASQGGTFLSRTWEPFAKGWLTDKNLRSYRVSYLDSAGSEHNTLIKVDNLGAVCFVEEPTA